jgi:hypothetical protein
VVAAVVTGDVWWALAAIAFVPMIVGSCGSCQRTVDDESDEANAVDLANELDASRAVEAS